MRRTETRGMTITKEWRPRKQVYCLAHPSHLTRILRAITFAAERGPFNGGGSFTSAPESGQIWGACSSDKVSSLHSHLALNRACTVRERRPSPSALAKTASAPTADPMLLTASP